MIAKVDKSDFSFTIDNSDFIPEKLLALKPKPTHQAYFSVLIEKNIFVSGGTKEIADDCQQHAETEHAKPEVHC